MNRNKFKIRSNFDKGFSIGEVILSVFILGVTMVTILALYSNGIRYFQDERDSVIASMLSQEGVELARNIRDNNWARRAGITATTPKAFDSFDVSSGSTEDDCRVDFASGSLSGGEVIYSTGVKCVGASYGLNTDGLGFYTHGSGTGTKFRRRMVLDYSDNKNLIVTSLVSWNTNNPPDIVSSCTIASKCVFSQTTLTNWGTGM